MYGPFRTLDLPGYVLGFSNTRFAGLCWNLVFAKVYYYDVGFVIQLAGERTHRIVVRGLGYVHTPIVASD